MDLLFGEVAWVTNDLSCAVVAEVVLTMHSSFLVLFGCVMAFL